MQSNNPSPLFQDNLQHYDFEARMKDEANQRSRREEDTQNTYITNVGSKVISSNNQPLLQELLANTTWAWEETNINSLATGQLSATKPVFIVCYYKPRNSSEEQRHRDELRATYTRNLRRAELKAAKFGSLYLPQPLEWELAEARENIAV